MLGAMLFDDRAWQWDSGKEFALDGGDKWEYQAEVPPLGAWLVLIPIEPSVLAKALDLPAPPAGALPVAE